jgi:hypothetical protein
VDTAETAPRRYAQDPHPMGNFAKDMENYPELMTDGLVI